MNQYKLYIYIFLTNRKYEKDLFIFLPVKCFSSHFWHLRLSFVSYQYFGSDKKKTSFFKLFYITIIILG